jgi:hypothetical protein
MIFLNIIHPRAPDIERPHDRWSKEDSEKKTFQPTPTFLVYMKEILPHQRNNWLTPC